MKTIFFKLKRKFGSVKISENLVLETLNYFTPFITEFELKRFGNGSDGGYLVPDDVEGIDCCISFGCGSDSAFEDDFGNYIDKSFSIFDEVDNFPEDFASSRHSFVPGWVGGFLKPKNATTPIYTLSTAIKHSYNQNFSDGLLKIDIESSEYTTLLSADEEMLKSFRIIIIEFHRVNEVIASSIFCLTLAQLMRKLLDNFMVVHFHPNNAVNPFKFEKQKFPSCFEVTLLRRDRIRTSRAVVGKYTHPLDVVNSELKESIQVSFPLGAQS